MGVGGLRRIQGHQRTRPVAPSSRCTGQPPARGACSDGCMQGEGTAANEAEDAASPAAAQAADPLRAAFEAHYEGLVRLCSLLAGRREDGEEIVQEAFARLARDPTRLASLPPEAVEPYLRRTAVNVWKNRWRRLRVEQRHRLKAGQITGVDPRTG
ncbi:MAG TPA: hypothetical protein DIT48_13440, partial [Actinobacteria bacterium]|nr:hypothetical protein [Actinomycetota bacterium]HCP61683.1 hypothetical protein [Actinomycetota bacterium]